MRKLSPAILAGAVALAFAGAAQAQGATGGLTVAPVQATPTQGSTATVSQGSTNNATTTSSVTTTTSSTGVPGTSSVRPPSVTADVRSGVASAAAQSTRADTATPDPQDTSTTDPNAVESSVQLAQTRAAEAKALAEARTATPPSQIASGLPTPGSTSGSTISGTSTGDAFTGSSRADSGIPATTAGTSISGTSSGDAFTGTSRGDATVTSTVRTPATAATTVLPEVATGGAVILSAEGERMAATASPLIVNQNVVTNGAAAGTETPELDRAVTREARRTARVPRNAQRLHTIAPRTNVDRSHEVPDDPPSPALQTPDRPLITR